MAYPFFGKSASSSTPGYAAFNLHLQASAAERKLERKPKIAMCLGIIRFDGEGILDEINGTGVISPLMERSRQADGGRQVDWDQLLVSVGKCSQPLISHQQCDASRQGPGLAGEWVSVARRKGL